MNKIWQTLARMILPLALLLSTVVPLSQASAAARDPVLSTDFEDGTVQGWTPRGSASLTVVTSEKHGGASSLLVGGRQATWHGASRDLTGRLDPGRKVHMSAWVLFTDGPGEQTIALSVQRGFAPGSGKSDKYDNVAQAQAAKGVWAKLEADYTVPADTDMNRISIYFETPWKPDNQATPGDLIPFYIDDVTITENAPLEIQHDIPDLHTVLDPYFPIGAAVDPVDLLNDSDVHSDLLKKHFKSLTAGNIMKPDALQPSEGTFVWTNADKLVQFAETNGMLVRGHTLVWHSQIPAWFFTDPADPGKPATREQLIARLETHIKTVVGRYKGRIAYWDVANEVLSESGGLRGAEGGSKWKDIIGDADGDGFDSDYIELAFQFAHEADPDAKLVINDYNLESSMSKLNGMVTLVQRLLAKGIPVHAVGFQMHISNSAPGIEQMRSAMEKIAALGVKVQVTELDMSIYANSSEAEKPVTEDILLEQAKRYRELFGMFKEEAQKGYLESVTLWGMADDGTWLDNFPVKGRKDAPPLFDRALQAKPAYWGIVDPSKLPVYRNAMRAARGTPVIGAAPDKIWQAMKPTPVDQRVNGRTGAAAEARTMWDEGHLYVLLQVKDSTRGSKDSAEIFIDPNYDKSAVYLPDDRQYTIGPGGSVPAGIQSVVTETPDGYAVQAAIPLNKAGAALEAGGRLGIDFRINDDQGDGVVASSAVWNDYTNHQSTDPSRFGDVVLGSAAKITDAIYGSPVIDGEVDGLWNRAQSIRTEVWVQGLPVRRRLPRRHGMRITCTSWPM
ncbi:endo-1,4-beta-xylanase [Paenibacillus sp. P25]|nr:endo-1,4-beta-xylanase [Paenibacillus sp. P25]